MVRLDRFSIAVATCLCMLHPSERLDFCGSGNYSDIGARTHSPSAFDWQRLLPYALEVAINLFHCYEETY